MYGGASVGNVGIHPHRSIATPDISESEPDLSRTPPPCIRCIKTQYAQALRDPVQGILLNGHYAPLTQRSADPNQLQEAASDCLL